jgi:hypothetical protein
MNEKDELPDIPEPVPLKPRPVLLTVACLFSFVYHILLLGLSGFFLLSSGRIAGIRNLYVPEDALTGGQVRLLFLTWFVLFLAGFAGTLLIWFQRRKGFYIFLASSLLMVVYHFNRPTVSPGVAGVSVVLLFLFGLFLKRLK